MLSIEGLGRGGGRGGGGGGGGHHPGGGGGRHHGGGFRRGSRGGGGWWPWWGGTDIIYAQACPEVYAPVLGVDGVVYDNVCYATNAGVAVARTLQGLGDPDLGRWVNRWRGGRLVRTKVFNGALGDVTDTMVLHPIWTLLGIGAAATGAVLGVRALRKSKRRR